MKTSEILKEVKTILWDGTGEYTVKNKYICYILKYNFKNNKKAIDLREYINRILGGSHVSVSTWLIDNGYTTWNHMHRNPKVFQDYRKRWIDAMIAEYQAKGD